MLGTGGEQHRSSGIAGRGDNGDTLLFRRDNALLDYGRAPVAAEPKAGNVDPSLHAIVERRDEIAATRVQRKPAHMQFRVRRIAADAVCIGRNGADDPRARRAMADLVLQPGPLFASPEIDAVLDSGQLLVAGSNAAVDQGDLDSGAAALSGKLMETYRLSAPNQRLGQRQ